eukprot:15438630-Alexandrium_andersonii.AAC.1
MLGLSERGAETNALPTVGTVQAERSASRVLPRPAQGHPRRGTGQVPQRCHYRVRQPCSAAQKPPQSTLGARR